MIQQGYYSKVKLTTRTQYCPYKTNVKVKFVSTTGLRRLLFIILFHVLVISALNIQNVSLHKTTDIIKTKE